MNEMTISSLIQDGTLLAIELIKGASKIIVDLYNYNIFGKFIVLYPIFYIIFKIGFFIFSDLYIRGIDFYYYITGKKSEFIDE